MVSQVESEKISNFTDWAGDRWYDFESWIGTLDIRLYLDDVNKYHKKVIDKNNASEEEIKKIFDAVAAKDSTYQGKIGEIHAQASACATFVKELNGTISPSAGSFSVTEIQKLQKKAKDFESNAKIFNEAHPLEDEAKVNKHKVLKTFIDLIGKAGQLGSVLGLVGKTTVSWMESGKFFVTGASTIASFAKNGNSLVKTIASWSKSNKQLDKLARMLPEQAKKVKLKRMFGLNDLYAGGASHASSWSTRFYNNYHKLDGPFKNYTAGGVKSACAWIGLGLSAISNGLSNIEEAKTGKISAERAVAETVVETAVDVGTAWAVGAAVTAGVAATIGSAPVLLVGAATVGVTMGLDFACKKITGKLTGEEKGLTETVSDAICDVGTAAINVGKKAVTATASFLKDKINIIKPAFGFKSLLAT